MDQETEFGYKLRQILNHGTEHFDSGMAKRLHASRQEALEHRRVAVRGMQLAGLGHHFADAVFGHGRTVLATVALIIGVSGTYLWQQFEQAAEFEEVDTALLADELPPAVYLDRGFHVWLEHSSHSSQ